LYLTPRGEADSVKTPPTSAPLIAPLAADKDLGTVRVCRQQPFATRPLHPEERGSRSWWRRLIDTIRFGSLKAEPCPCPSVLERSYSR